MFRTSIALGRRRLSSLAVAAFLGASLVAPSGAAATVAPVSAAAVTAAESSMVSALNVDRTAAGLVPVRIDPRLMAIARARSADMVENAYFSHVQPDGRNVFDILTAQHISWSNAGEIIAANSYPMDVTVSTANRQWMNSAGHHAIIVSTNLNYVGVGLAMDPATGKKIWTAVFIKGPDRTGAGASVAKPALAAGSSSANRSARVAWAGADVRLQVLTAGLRSFAVQRRIDGGAWTNVYSSTTARARTFTVYLHHRYEFRISAYDKAGNRGAWVTTVVDLR